MTARTHDLVALTLLLAVLIIAKPDSMTVATVLSSLLANQLGGIAPDIDQPTAPFWRNLPVGRYVGKVFATLVGGHRFICHSLIGVGLFALVSRLFLEFIHPIIPRIDIDIVWVAFLVGIVSHLAMDMFTKEGVPLLLPIPLKIGIPPIRAWRVTTGKKVETFILFPLLLIGATWLCVENYDTLARIIQNQLFK